MRLVVLFTLLQSQDRLVARVLFLSIVGGSSVPVVDDVVCVADEVSSVPGEPDWPLDREPNGSWKVTDRLPGMNDS